MRTQQEASLLTLKEAHRDLWRPPQHHDHLKGQMMWNFAKSLLHGTLAVSPSRTTMRKDIKTCKTQEGP
ncbi:hypothetical protein QQF64_003896 [Cirrhinus molitorella]|uniref:Uncharacterized protein n=2 Tax=Cirrhinus molitorella TaxID=172907 RepID=A0AA88TCX1_9TELE|nr:hypothetical protein Q8A67_021318 [Cirrhinus molitorella]